MPFLRRRLSVVVRCKLLFLAVALGLVVTVWALAQIPLYVYAIAAVFAVFTLGVTVGLAAALAVASDVIRFRWPSRAYRAVRAWLSAEDVD